MKIAHLLLLTIWFGLVVAVLHSEQLNDLFNFKTFLGLEQVAPRTSLERLTSKLTALLWTSLDRSEGVHSYMVIMILYYKRLCIDY